MNFNAPFLHLRQDIRWPQSAASAQGRGDKAQKAANATPAVTTAEAAVTKVAVLSNQVLFAGVTQEAALLGSC